MELPKELSGTFFAPCAIELKSLSQLSREVFGPVLHIIRFKATELDRIIDDINSTHYGLTFGIHSRVNETIEAIHSKVAAGNTYVNRNMIGAVVGVQPFGGEGLSGTGPKAGGPNYLNRLVTERVLTINVTAAGGNAPLLSLKDSE
jgi:RHH-type proline utilization regulon transcriptional repressor/proline dehydrogenase/delta 1-pyrroline-5-carboxylate dehydrogenase